MHRAMVCSSWRLLTLLAAGPRQYNRRMPNCSIFNNHLGTLILRAITLIVVLVQVQDDGHRIVTANKRLRARKRVTVECQGQMKWLVGRCKLGRAVKVVFLAVWISNGHAALSFSRISSLADNKALDPASLQYPYQS